MSSGKKGKKKKGVTVDLWSFLADGSGPPNVPLKSSSWADDVEDDHEGFSSRSNKDPVILPTAPRAALGPGIDEENIPTGPPYVAYISNLPYDVDEADLADFFADMKISNMRLPKDANKIRGYGYVEFEDRQSLIDALSMTNTTIKTRRVRIEVSNSSNDERRGGRMGRDSRRDMYDDPERTSGDWRSGPREELQDGDSYRGRYDNRDRRDDNRYEYDNKPGAWRERDATAPDKGSAFKDRAGFRDDDSARGGGERDWNRYGDRGSRDREGGGSSFGPRRNYGDNDWDRDRRQDRSTSDPKPESRTRPKLQLQPRTKPVEAAVAVAEEPPAESSTESKSESTQQASTSTPVPATNIFGAAKPVDTTAREREIEERLAKSYAESRSREETDNKERSSKDGAWGRRNGEGRDDKDKERSRPTWRSEEDGGARIERSAPRSQPASARSEQQNESKVSPGPSRSGSSAPKGAQKPAEKDVRASDRDRKEREKDEISKMPKAKDEQAPNFVASNKYSMLPDDVDPDNIDD